MIVCLVDSQGFQYFLRRCFSEFVIFHKLNKYAPYRLLSDACASIDLYVHRIVITNYRSNSHSKKMELSLREMFTLYASFFFSLYRNGEKRCNHPTQKPTQTNLGGQGGAKQKDYTYCTNQRNTRKRTTNTLRAKTHGDHWFLYLQNLQLILDFQGLEYKSYNVLQDLQFIV